MTNKQQQVYDLLLMPIVCDDRRRSTPVCDGSTILTGQSYTSTYVDEDMSDFAVGFYETVYGRPILDHRGCLADLEFAGDTMNSFETTAFKVLGPREKRLPEDQWPSFLLDYKRRYHCLANFWILPMETGRTLKGELNKARRAADYMDRYLNILQAEVPFDGSGRRFYREFRDWDDFVDRQFLRQGYLDEQGYIKEMSRGTAEKFVAKAIRAMEGRARELAELEPLWFYFQENELL